MSLKSTSTSASRHSRAVLWHRPQDVATAKRSSKQDIEQAPSRTARQMSFSVMLLQIQTYMLIALSTNEKRSLNENCLQEVVSILLAVAPVTILAMSGIPLTGTA